MNLRDCATIVKEYKIPWLFNRSLYALKLRLLQTLPLAEAIFEKKAEVRRIQLLQIDVIRIQAFLRDLNEDAKRKIIEDADRAAKGIIKCFSSINLDYGYPIEWNINPLTKSAIPYSMKWFEIPDFHPIRGDIKVIWEVSRFSHFYLFARAYMLTGDKKYYGYFSEQLNDWLEKNPYSYGPNFKCGQECSLRMMNALMVYTAFKEFQLTSKKDEENIKELIRRCYKKICSNFFYAEKCIKNNHTLSELCGMITGAWCCEDNKRLEKAYTLLNRNIKSQFFEDGGYKQYSFTYQRLALQLMEYVLKISKVTGKEIEPCCKERLAKSVELLYQMQNEDGDVPNYGSNDGALIFPVHSCDYRDFRPVIASLTRLLCHQKIYTQGVYDEEALWFANNEQSIKYEVYPKKNSYFPQGGFATLWKNDAFAMICLQHYISRPAHMDQLHIDLWYQGINVLCDCGTYSYADKFGQALSMTEGHNTVKIPEKEQMKKKGAFFIYAWPRVKMARFDSNEFEGKVRFQTGYSHYRKLSAEDGGFKIYDSVKGVREYKLIFHTPCEVKITDGGAELYNGKKHMVTLFNADARVESKSAYSSLYYLQKEKITKLEFSLSQKKSITYIKLEKGDKEND